MELVKLKLRSLEPLTREGESFKIYDVVSGRVDDYLDLRLGGTPSLLLGHAASGKTLLATVAYCLPMYVDEAFFREAYDLHVQMAADHYLRRRGPQSSVEISVGRLLVSMDRDVAKAMGLPSDSYELCNLRLLEHKDLVHKIVVSYLACSVSGVPEYLHLLIPITYGSDERYQRVVEVLASLRDHRLSILAWAEEAVKKGEVEGLGEAFTRALLTLATLPRLHPYHLAMITSFSEGEYGCDVLKETVGVSVQDVERAAARVLDVDGIALHEVSTYLSTGVNTIITVLASAITLPYVSRTAYDALCASGVRLSWEGGSPLYFNTALFVDEPFSGLPLPLAAEFWREAFGYLSRLRKVYVSTHRFEVFGFSDETKPREVVVLLRSAKNAQRVIDELRLVDPNAVNAVRVDAEYLQSDGVVPQRLRKALAEDFG